MDNIGNVISKSMKGQYNMPIAANEKALDGC